MTETASSMTFTGPCDAATLAGRPPGFAGRAAIHVGIDVVDERGNSVGPGAVGQVVTWGPHLMRGYLEGAKVCPHTGALMTGDLGSLDGDGNLVLRGRQKDMIKTGGENVYAPEVEEVILQHPRVASCAVFPMPDLRYGEIVCAAVELRELFGMAPSGERDAIRAAIAKLCREKLSGYKVPRRLIFMDTLPVNSSGKVLKYEIRRILTAAL